MADLATLFRPRDYGAGAVKRTTETRPPPGSSSKARVAPWSSAEWVALTAGLDISRGAYILILDADLQDPPELLSNMMAELKAQDAGISPVR